MTFGIRTNSHRYFFRLGVVRFIIFFGSVFLERLFFLECSVVLMTGRKQILILFDVQGKLYVRGDSKIFRFQNGKSESLFLQRKNPRRIAWTVLFRRQHKKGISEVGTTFITPGFECRYYGNNVLGIRLE